MATLRSEFSFKQVEWALQRFAYKIASEAVETMQTKIQDIHIRAFKSRLSYVETDEYLIKFYCNHVTVVRTSTKGDTRMSFDFEEKEYTTSNHRGKISFAVYPEDKIPEERECIIAFINELMGEEKPQPRFALKKIQRS